MKNIDPGLLSNLPTYADEGSVYAVVEAPKGSGVKFKYDEKLRAFTGHSRSASWIDLSL
jgi:inorganic pyrophosphatase